MREDFSKTTIDKLAKRAGLLCSNPNCRVPTMGANSGSDGVLNIGVAAHITAASPGGPRYDANMKSEERRHRSNGIWLCQNDAKLIDSDVATYTTEKLREWKRLAEQRSFAAVVGGRSNAERQIPALEAFDKLLAAAQADIDAFKQTSIWPAHDIALNLRLFKDGTIHPFGSITLASALPTFNELVLVAPPGMGKTTSMVQVSQALIAQRQMVPIFIPLGEWAAQEYSVFETPRHRRAFADIPEQDLKDSADVGRLVLLLDGWNELDPASRQRATAELRALQREFPSLGLVISTRRQALDVPIEGLLIDIDLLSGAQQLELARAARGDEGEALLDRAWRTAGIRELVAIPLYLNAFLSQATVVGMVPTTKEELLRLFVAEHERQPEKADILRQNLFGFHDQFLTSLAVELNRTERTTITEENARAVVKRVEDRLVAEGQITTAPQPMALLDVLVNQHLLVRSGATEKTLSFQHQQFQEWYASLDVANRMLAAVTDPAARQALRADILNVPAWEESVFFACERLSRGPEPERKAVANTILETVGIDPMFAAELIYRSSEAVWNQIKEPIIAFANRWHSPGKTDRTVRFMLRTARPEFASTVWPLIAAEDNQVYLRTLRAAPFRPSILGPDPEARLASLPDDTRGQVLAEIVLDGGFDGIELAAKMAKNDPKTEVQVSVIEALLFRRADRYAAEILRGGSQEVWREQVIPPPFCPCL